MKTTLNNFQPFKICIGVHFPSRTWFPKFIKMTLRLFVILNSFTYIMLWSRFYNLCQYTPLLTAHQELQKLVLSWSFREKMSRLRLEMNVRCLKKTCHLWLQSCFCCYCLLFSKRRCFWRWHILFPDRRMFSEWR